MTAQHQPETGGDPGQNIVDTHGFLEGLNPEEIHFEDGRFTAPDGSVYTTTADGTVWKVIPPEQAFSGMPKQPESIKNLGRDALQARIREEVPVPQDLSGETGRVHTRLGNPGIMDSPGNVTRTQYSGSHGEGTPASPLRVGYTVLRIKPSKEDY